MGIHDSRAVELRCQCGEIVVRELTPEEEQRYSQSPSAFIVDCRACYALLLEQLRRSGRERRWLYDGPKYKKLSA